LSSPSVQTEGEFNEAVIAASLNRVCPVQCPVNVPGGLVSVRPDQAAELIVWVSRLAPTHPEAKAALVATWERFGWK
jgi:hypothetical protein